MEKKKFLSMKDWSVKDYKKNAILGILMGVVGNMSGIIFVEIIGGVLFLAGIVLGIIWIVKKNKKKESPSSPSFKPEKENFSLNNIKNNKILKIFLLIILIVIAIAGSFYFYQINQKKVNLEKELGQKIECKKLGDKYIQDNYKNDSTSFIIENEMHFNHRLNTCLLYINKHETFLERGQGKMEIIDILTNKPLITFVQSPFYGTTTTYKEFQDQRQILMNE